MAMLGDLQDFGLFELFQLLEKGSKTGQLSIWAPQGIHRILFYQGRVIGAVHPNERHNLEPLLRHLHQQNRVSEAVVLKIAGACQMREPLGSCLQRQGLVDNRLLSKVFRLQLEHTVYPLFGLAQGQFTFVSQAPVLYANMTGLSQGATAVALEAVRKVGSLEDLPSAETCFGRSSQSLPTFRLTVLEWAILDQVHPTLSLQDLSQRIGEKLLDIQQATTRLQRLGLLSLSSAESPANPLGVNHEPQPSPQPSTTLIHRLTHLLRGRVRIPYQSAG